MMITIRRELKIDSKGEQAYLLMNMNYRHDLYNAGVAIIRAEKEANPTKLIGAYELGTMIYNRYEKDLKSYKFMATGIREIVATDLEKMMKDVWKKPKWYDNPLDRYRFKSFRKYNRSFGFTTKIENLGDGKFRSKVKDFTDNSITISMGKNKWHTYYIKEKSWNNKHSYDFGQYDIKEIHFVFKNGRFFINLVTEVNFDSVKNCEHKRDSKAGIDLGERNPAIIYDGKSYIKVKSPDTRIKRLNKRIDRLHEILSKKQDDSNNADKVRLKINKLYRKAYYIRHDWRFKVAFIIVTSYDNIVVDNFTIPICSKKSRELIPSARKLVNRNIHDKGMGYFMRALQYMADKYDCKYIESDEFSTRKCSNCGHINDPLPNGKRILHCANCGKKINRDENAAKNCYMQPIKPNKLIISI